MQNQNGNGILEQYTGSLSQHIQTEYSIPPKYYRGDLKLGLRNSDGTGVPIDIYDAAAWMAVTCLSEESIALGGAPVAIPDFTGGRWIHGVNSYTGPYDLQAIPDIPGV